MRKERTPTTMVRITKATKDRLKKLAADQDTSILALLEKAVKQTYNNT
jgi:predicted transcriptional regulator